MRWLLLSLLFTSCTPPSAKLQIESSSTSGLTFAEGSLVDFASDTTRTLTLVNGGTSTLTLDAAPQLPAPFGFQGGSFPGEGGDCTLALAPGRCQVVLSRAADGSTAPHAAVTIRYHDGDTTKMLALLLKAD